MREILVLLSLFSLVILPSLGKADINGYDALANWLDLPNDKTDQTPGIASSYDRSGGNNDYNYYYQPTGLQTGDVNTVITELTGPGMVTRFWMPHATANAVFPIKITVDGTVVVNTNSNTFLDGLYSYFKPPLIYTLAGGQVSYEPILFQNSLKIESHNYTNINWAKYHHYYQYNYTRFAPDKTVVPCTGALTMDQISSRNVAAQMLASAGSNPAGASSTAILSQNYDFEVPAGTSRNIANVLTGGYIRSIHLKMPSIATDNELESLILRVKYDNSLDFAIDVPVAHFFGAGFGRAPFKSLPIGTDSLNGYYCFWPMPFRNAISIELYNNGYSEIRVESTIVEYETADVSCDNGYLHAVYAKETTYSGQQFHILLNVKGKGHYVGNLLYLEHSGDSRNMLEADDVITVNPGSIREHTLFGTGLEDAYNGGYYYNHVLEQNNDGETADPARATGPYSGLLYMDFFDLPGFARSRTDQYRWLIPDYVPFTDGILVRIETYVANTSIGSTAFYYRLCERTDFSVLSVFARNWLKQNCFTPGWCAELDIDQNGNLNWIDLSSFAHDWLQCR